MAIGPVGNQYTQQLTGRLEDLQRQVRADAARLLEAERPTATADSAEITAQTRQTARLRGLQELATQLQEGVTVAQTADAALRESRAEFQAIRELVQQAEPTTDFAVLQEQVDARTARIDAVLRDTKFAGEPLFDGARTTAPPAVPELSVQVLAGESIEVHNLEAAQYALPRIEQAIEQLGSVREGLGQAQNRLTRASDELRSAAQNVVAASVGQGDLVGSVVDLKLSRLQFSAALGATRAHLETSEAVLELLR